FNSTRHPKEMLLMLFILSLYKGDISHALFNSRRITWQTVNSYHRRRTRSHAHQERLYQSLFTTPAKRQWKRKKNGNRKRPCGCDKWSKTWIYIRFAYFTHHQK